MKLALITIIAGSGALAMFASAQNPKGSPEGDADLRMTAAAPLLLLDGTPVDLLGGAGHAGPLVMDLDGEGPMDLLVGDLRGSLEKFVGRSTDAGIRYEHMGKLQYEGEDIRVHNW